MRTNDELKLPATPTSLVETLTLAPQLDSRRMLAPMIARVWHGITRIEHYDAYWQFLHARAIPDYRSIPGNVGVRLFRRLQGEHAHFLTLSYWRDLSDIRAFAGSDIERAKYYPEDKAFLVEFEPTVLHYEVTESDYAAGDSEGTS